MLSSNLFQMKPLRLVPARRSIKATLCAAVVLSVLAAAAGYTQSNPPMGAAQVTPGDDIDRAFGGNRPAETPAPWMAPAPGQAGSPTVISPPGGGQNAPRPVAQPAPGQPLPQTGQPSQAQPARPAPTPAQQMQQGRPAGAPPAQNVQSPGQPGLAPGGGQVAPVRGDPIDPARQPLRLPAPAPGPVVIQQEIQPANEIDMTEDDALRQIESLTRQRRIFELQRLVEAEKLGIERALADRRKIANELRGPQPNPIIDPPAPPPPSPPPATQNSVSSSIERPDGDIVSQMAVLTIAGPADRLVATVRVNGFGNVQVRSGGTLPGNVRVVSLSSNGLTVRPPSGGVRLVPFAQ
ncbi:MAG: hypothetical protein K2X45_11580 [Phreatobacter sp.]|nr:hypothetical protein [Phreatobacter sp.]